VSGQILGRPPVRWSGRPPAIKGAHVDELLALRRTLDSLPFRVRICGEDLKDLAAKWGVSVQTARDYLGSRMPKRLGEHGGR
jgi:hypothetical protein